MLAYLFFPGVMIVLFTEEVPPPALVRTASNDGASSGYHQIAPTLENIIHIHRLSVNDRVP